jgi:two-component system NtrC family sensor kinase
VLSFIKLQQGVKLAKILEQRNSLHKRLATVENFNSQLKSEIGQMQPLANIGLISSMIAHEMNNILTPIGNYAQLALNYKDDEKLTEKALHKAIHNSARATKILESMLAMASGRKQTMQSVNLRTVLDEIFDCMARDFDKDGITVDIHIPEATTIYSETICLQQVLMNLILNAREAMLGSNGSSKGGRLTISAETCETDITINVSDTGSGIADRDIYKVFEPFFTTKTGESEHQRQGNGLGLAFCKRVIDSHNGEISVRSKPSVGTTFTITLPIPASDH